MNGEPSGINLGTLAAIYLGLLLFGIGYNLLTAWAEKKGYMKGYTSLFVVLGVGVTITATALISFTFALVTAGAFIASGLPMIAGSMWRHMIERERLIQQLRDEARNGNGC